MTAREQTRTVRIGNRMIGGGNPIAIQSMCNTKTENVKETVEQIHRLETAGCEIIRVTVPTMEAARAVKEIKKEISIPLVADIHFDYRMAIAAIENGADKIRINPGNIGSEDRVRAVVDTARAHNVPIRVGVNSGSLEKNLIEKYGGVTAEGIVESALDKVKMIEDMGYDNLVISIKSSDVLMCIRAHELIAGQTRYPLHVGITEAGTLYSGNIKSAAGLGIILYQGIGDTIRVSLTGDPVEEIKSAKLILKTLGLRKGGIEVVSCPTCGRTRIDLIHAPIRLVPQDPPPRLLKHDQPDPRTKRSARAGIASRRRRHPAYVSAGNLPSLSQNARISGRKQGAIPPCLRGSVFGRGPVQPDGQSAGLQPPRLVPYHRDARRQDRGGFSRTTFEGGPAP